MKTLKHEEVYRQEYRDLHEAKRLIGHFIEPVYNVYTGLLKKHGVTISMSRFGNPYDNLDITKDLQSYSRRRSAVKRTPIPKRWVLQARFERMRQDPAHHLRGDRHELSPILPVRLVLTHKVQVRFVNQSGGLKGVVRPFLTHHMARQPAQLPVTSGTSSANFLSSGWPRSSVFRT